MAELTIEGQTWYIPASSWFYYDGTVQSLPEWLLDDLANKDATRSATGHVVLVHPLQGYPLIEPNSLVFVRDDHAIQTLRGAKHVEVQRQGVASSG